MLYVLYRMELRNNESRIKSEGTGTSTIKSYKNTYGAITTSADLSKTKGV